MTREDLRKIIEDSDTEAGRVFDIASQTLVVISLISFTLETGREPSAGVKVFLDWMEIIIVGFFTVEYLLRVWVSKKKRKYIFSFFGLIDLIAVLPFYIGAGIDLRSLRILRIGRLLFAFKLVRYSRALRRLRDAVIMVKAELSVFLAATFLLLYVSSVGIYYCERAAQPDKFSSILDSLWWAVVTLTTIGYGDMYPITVGGRVFTSLISLIGIGIIAIPTGLITSAMVTVINDQKE